MEFPYPDRQELEKGVLPVYNAMANRSGHRARAAIDEIKAMANATE